MSIEHILIIDDDPHILALLSEILGARNFSVSSAPGVKQAIKQISNCPFDLIISDMNMPDGSGLDIIQYTKQHRPQTPILVITAFGTIQNAVEAMRFGAFNYLTKPFSPDALFTLIAKAEELQALQQDNLFLQSQGSSISHPLIAESPSMKQLLDKARRAANSSANIFVHGESGCGKENLSFFIHKHSPRSTKPYIKVNCAAIPDTLLESEFFGHEKGAFTGATTKKVGRFELAHQGTLLLDEITEIPIHLQAKLLRAIQEQEFEHIGGIKTLPVNIRFLATSNRDLEEAIETKVLRQDLYYRLSVISLHIPPLRDRKEDILPLAHYYLEKFCKMNSKPPKTLSLEAQRNLLDYSWPGNVRELSNVLERTVILENDPAITPSMLALL